MLNTQVTYENITLCFDLLCKFSNEKIYILVKKKILRKKKYSSDICE